MEESNYCILCQEQHTTTAQCMECKSCGMKGHVRKDCPRSLKRKQESQEKNSSQVSKALKSSLLNDGDIVIKDISGSSVNSCNEDIDNVNVSVQEKNMNNIHISDDDEKETQRNNNNVPTYEKYWKLYESKKGKRRVVCPWCINNVDLINIHHHIARVHIKNVKEISGKSLLCPKCNTTVPPSVLWEHIDAGCVAPPPLSQCSSNSSTVTPTRWMVEKKKYRNKQGYFVLCPWCDVLIHLKYISKHIGKIHKKGRSSTSQHCPSCEKAVLASEVCAHITSCLPSIRNHKSASSTQDLPKNTGQSKLNPKPSVKASQTPPSHDQQKSTLISSQDVLATGKHTSEVLSSGFSQSFIDNHTINELESASLNDECGSSTYDLRSKMQKAANPAESSVSVSETFIEKLDLFLKEMRQQTNSGFKSQV